MRFKANCAAHQHCYCLYRAAELYVVHSHAEKWSFVTSGAYRNKYLKTISYRLYMENNWACSSCRVHDVELPGQLSPVIIKHSSRKQMRKHIWVLQDTGKTKVHHICLIAFPREGQVIWFLLYRWPCIIYSLHQTHTCPYVPHPNTP